MPAKVLFICVHNSARSQMAEAFLNEMAGGKVLVESAGFEPTTIKPLVVKVMAETGIDLSEKSTQSVFSLVRNNTYFGHVITVCDRAREADCPIFPGVVRRLHWDLENPEDFSGTEEEVLEKVRALRDQIRTLVSGFIQEHLSMKQESGARPSE